MRSRSQHWSRRVGFKFSRRSIERIPPGTGCRSEGRRSFAVPVRDLLLDARQRPQPAAHAEAHVQQRQHDHADVRPQHRGQHGALHLAAAQRSLRDDQPHRLSTQAATGSSRFTLDARHT